MQTIYGVSTYPLKEGYVSVNSLGGKFKAAIVDRDHYEHDPSSIYNSLEHAGTHSSYDQRISDHRKMLVLMPAEDRLYFRMDQRPINPINYTTTVGLTDSWTKMSTLSKTMIILVAVLILLLFLWGVWKIISGSKMNKMNNTFY